MSAEQDPVRRLAEIRAREVITSHPLPLEVRGAVDVLCSMIDSLTAERDRLALWIGEAIEGKFGVLVATGFADLVACTHTRAEAAEADRERLREVLDRVLSSFKRALAGGVIRDADEVIAEAEAALATPPSEGQS